MNDAFLQRAIKIIDDISVDDLERSLKSAGIDVERKDMPKQEQYAKIRVTVEMDYLVPIHNGDITKVNGWTLDEVQQDWFKDHNINMYHCARDTSLIGGSKVIKNIEIVK